MQLKIKVQNFQYFVAFFLFILPFWWIKDTSDWEHYVDFFANPNSSRDIAFSFLSIIFSYFGYDFEDLYRFHIIIITISFLWLFKILKINPILMTLIVILTNYVSIANQIRFYVAFPLGIISFYYVIQHKLLKSLFLLILSILFQKSILIIFLILYIYKKINKLQITNQVLSITFLNLLIYGIISSGYMFSNNYSTYTETSYTSSILGGIFTIFPFFCPIYFIFNDNNIIRTFYKKQFLKDQYQFLAITSLACSCFILPALFYQIITQRFILPLIPIWFAFMKYCSSFSKHKMKYMIECRILIALILFWIFIVTPLFGFTEYMKKSYQQIMSIFN